MSEEKVDPIRAKLKASFAPQRLEIVDETGDHFGHAAAREGKRHLRVCIVSGWFAGLPTIERHRAVYQVLAAELRSWLHALRIEALTPEEWNARCAESDGR